MNKSDSEIDQGVSEKEVSKTSQVVTDLSVVDSVSHSALPEIKGKTDAFEPDLLEESELIAEKSPCHNMDPLATISINGATDKVQGKKKPKSPYECKLIVVVILLFIIVIITIITVYLVYESTGLRVHLKQDVTIEMTTRNLYIFNRHKEIVLTGKLGRNIPTFRLPLDCSREPNKSPICLNWKDVATLSVDVLKEGAVSCYQFSWHQRTLDAALSDCFDLSTFHWYGLGFLKDQKWPLERSSIANQRLLLGSQHQGGDIGQLFAYIWVTSSGTEISANSELPMNVTMNARNANNDTDKQLCISVNLKDYRALRLDRPLADLVYNVCIADSAVEVEKDPSTSVKFLLDNPSLLPDERNFQAPIWSTCGKFEENITQTVILSYAADIVAHNYPYSLLVINEGWEKEVGDLDFDKIKFPTPVKMTQTLVQMGFSLSLQVTPLISSMSETMHEAMNRLFLVRDVSYAVPGLVRFPRSVKLEGVIGGVIDVTHPNASQWFMSKLYALKTKYSLFSLRFVAGETIYLPFLSSFGGDLHDPNHFATYVGKLATQMGPNNHVCVAFESQAYGGLQCLPDLQGTWASLRQIIPIALTTSILGYPLFVPDPVGGSHNVERPSEELYVRWMQVVAFFPIMHFSIPPHEYRKEVVSYALELMALHKSIIFPRVQRYFNNSVRNEPLILPLWWIAPYDDIAQQVDDEFLVGNDLLVAPVLDNGAHLRDIYIPEGVWKDVLKNATVSGPVWIKNYSVGLMEVPYFEKAP